jgi:hypothetical protein
MTFSWLYSSTLTDAFLLMYVYVSVLLSFFFPPENWKTSVLRVLSQTSLFNWRVPFASVVAVVWAIIDYASECMPISLKYLQLLSFVSFLCVCVLYSILSDCILCSFWKSYYDWETCASNDVTVRTSFRLFFFLIKI